MLGHPSRDLHGLLEPQNHVDAHRVRRAAGDIWRLIVDNAARMALAGIAIGLSGAFALTRLRSALLYGLYGVTATDPLTFGIVALLLVGAALLACSVPVRKAMRIDPVAALRRD
jgi:hypothetical protein